VNKFIVFEGIDGSGKTTQAKLLAKRLNGTYTCEPTNGEIGELIRKILSGKKCEKETLALLFAADRIEHVKKIEEKVKEGHVICDRYVYSSLVYQSTQGIEESYILEINKHAKRPDVVILLDVDLEIAMKRMEHRSKEVFEKREFLKKIREKYLELANSNFIFKPKDDFIVVKVDSGDINFIHEKIVKILKDKNIIDKNV